MQHKRIKNSSKNIFKENVVNSFGLVAHKICTYIIVTATYYKIIDKKKNIIAYLSFTINKDLIEM